MKTYFKNIAEALPVIRPGDKVVRILSNKVAIVRSVFTSGKFHIPCVMYLHDGVIYGLGSVDNAPIVIEHRLSYPNTKRVRNCYEHKENGKPFHYLFKIEDNRKWKKTARRIKRTLIAHELIKG